MSNDDVLARLTAALADRYRIDREIGAGGMVTVHLAHETTAARLQHPHILPLLDLGNWGSAVRSRMATGGAK